MAGQHKGQIVGYVRVSAADQNQARQLQAIGDIDRLFSEKASGKNTDRAQLQEMIAGQCHGDTLRVKSPDRLARSTTDLLALVEQLGAKGVAVEWRAPVIGQAATRRKPGPSGSERASVRRCATLPEPGAGRAEPVPSKSWL